jgi:hypothetical protein
MERITYKIPCLHHDPKEPRKTEAEILAEIKTWLKISHVFFVRIDGSPKIVNQKKNELAFIPSDHVGMPDLIAFRKGHFYGIEVKQKKWGKLSESQAKTLCNILEAGCKAAIVCSVEGIRRFLANEIAEEFCETHYGNVPVFY